MKNRGGGENMVDDPSGSVSEVAKTANKAVRDTAQRYLSAAGMRIDLEDVEQRIRDRAFLSLGLAAGAGFALGGGLGTRLGAVLLAVFGRAAARQVATNVGRQVFQGAR
ncbi:MAG: hypothetical protein JO166_21050 [Deltaproteobacteria bacterium]|nr:hypothetical protein [Deltaproteobacteria bacterium]